jgi:hypothetical protein
VNVIVANLPNPVLGLGELEMPTIWLDDNAAGHGWTLPWHVGVGATPQRGMDLFTVVTHELGHVLGLADVDADLYPEDIMAGRLAVGERRVDSGLFPSTLTSSTSQFGLPLAAAAMRFSAVDELFSQDDTLRAEQGAADEDSTDRRLAARASEWLDALDPAHLRRRTDEKEQHAWDQFFADLLDPDDESTDSTGA